MKTKLAQTIDAAAAVLNDIKESIAATGVEVPEGTPASAYGAKVAQVYSAGAESARGYVDEAVFNHNTDTDSHNDIRLLIDGLTTRLNAVANSTDTDLDQLAEIVAYIKNNKNLIDGVTTNKVNVSDIIDNLTTNVSNKPLSARMGVEIKKLIDAIKIPTSLPASDVYDWAKAATKPAYTKSEVGLGNVDNVKQYSANNPPPYPVTSVNNKTGAVSLSASDVGALPNTTVIPTKTSQLTNDSGYITNEHNSDPSAHEDKANKSEGSFYIEGSGTTDSSAKTSTWVGTSDRITEYYDGLSLRYKIGVAGQSTTTLNINGLGAKTVYLFNTTKLTTQFPVNSIINLIYHADLNKGCWVCSDYDSNTNTYQRVYPTTTDAEYPLTARYNVTTGSSYYAEYGRYSDGVTLNPATKTITADNFKGTATKATQDASGNDIEATYAKKSNSEEWTFVLEDGTTITKKVLLG